MFESHSLVSPQLLHHVLHLLAVLRWWDLSLLVALGCKLGHVHLSKLLEGEGPTM